MAQTPEQQFWTWFRQREPVLRQVQTGREPVCEELAAELQRVQPELVYEFEANRGGRRVLTISADGIVSAFPAVERLVAAAPALSAWRVIAFRQGSPGPRIVEIAERRVSSADVLVRLAPDGSKTGLTIAMPGYRTTFSQSFERAGYLLLDALLGEYLVGTRVGFIEFVALESTRPGRWIRLDSLRTRLK
jgi:hypothetical protein